MTFCFVYFCNSFLKADNFVIFIVQLTVQLPWDIQFNLFLSDHVLMLCLAFLTASFLIDSLADSLGVFLKRFLIDEIVLSSRFFMVWDV